jgi:uncharacterized membrane protein HdeD (DUF308 family)
MENKIIVGILAIIFGLLILVFPFISQFVLSVIAGIGILILGIYFLIVGSSMWSFTKAGSIVYVIIGFLGMLAGIMLLGNVLLFGALISLYLYISGFMLLLAGLVGVLTRPAMTTKASAVLMLILGIVTIVLGYFALLSPVYVSIILGLSLIIDGVAIATGNYEEIVE